MKEVAITDTVLTIIRFFFSKGIATLVKKKYIQMFATKVIKIKISKILMNM